MDTPFNKETLDRLKRYVNNNFKMIGFEYKPTSDVFSSALDDILTIKILCNVGHCSTCSKCNCEKVTKFFNSFGMKYNFYIEQHKMSVNGHFEFHKITIFIKKD